MMKSSIPNSNVQSLNFLLANKKTDQTHQNMTKEIISSIGDRKKSQGVLQNLNNVANNQITKKGDFKTSSESHQNVLKTHPKEKKPNFNSPLQSQNETKARNEGSGHLGSSETSSKLKNYVNQFSKQDQAQLIQQSSPQKNSDEGNMPPKKIQQQKTLGAIGIQKEKLKNPVHSYSNSLTNQKNKSSSCTSPQNNFIQPQSPVSSLKPSTADNYILRSALNQGNSLTWNGGLDKVTSNLLEQQKQYQQPYIQESNTMKTLFGKSQSSSSQSSQQSQQQSICLKNVNSLPNNCIQGEQQYNHNTNTNNNKNGTLNNTAAYTQASLKKNDFYEVILKMEKEKAICQINSKNIKNWKGIIGNPQNNGDTYNSNIALLNSSPLPQSFAPQVQKGKNYSVKGGTEIPQSTKNKKQLTINTAEIQQSYNSPIFSDINTPQNQKDANGLKMITDQFQQQQSHPIILSNQSSCNNRPSTSKNSNVQKQNNYKHSTLSTTKAKQFSGEQSDQNLAKQIFPKQQNYVQKEAEVFIFPAPNTQVKEENKGPCSTKFLEGQDIPFSFEPFFLSPKHPKSLPQSTKSQKNKMQSTESIEFPQILNLDLQAIHTDQVNISHNLSQSCRQKDLQQEANYLAYTPVPAVFRQKRSGQEAPSLGHTPGTSLAQTNFAINKKLSQREAAKDLKCNSHFKQSTTRDTSIQKLQRPDLIKIIQRTSQVLQSYARQKEFWHKEKQMLLNEVNQLRSRLHFYEENVQIN